MKEVDFPVHLVTWTNGTHDMGDHCDKRDHCLVSQHSIYPLPGEEEIDSCLSLGQ